MFNIGKSMVYLLKQFDLSMGHGLLSPFQIEAKRLVLVIALVLASIIAIQYFELPDSTVIRSIFSSKNPQVPGLSPYSDENGSAYPNVFGNITSLNPYHTGINHSYVQINKSTSADEDRDVKNDFVSEKNGNSGDSLELDEIRSDPETEPLSKDSTHSKADNDVPVKALSPTTSPSSLVIGDNYSLGRNWKPSILIQENSVSIVSSPVKPSLTPPPFTSSLNLDNATHVNTIPTPLISVFPNASSNNRSTGNFLQNDKKSVELKNNVSTHRLGRGATKPLTQAVSISDMNDLLLRSRSSLFSMKPRWSSAVDKDLRNVKLQIKKASELDNHPGLYAPLFRNVSMFKRSYELMEQTLKVYIYDEGERPIFHTPVLKGIYASEGWFMKLLRENKHFVTKTPKEAHLFYLPFSSRLLEETLYVPNSHSRKNMVRFLKNYLDVITWRYRFWNRTGGADHFLVACHDWSPSEIKRIMGNCIRALCNSDVKEGFKFGKDVSLPETYVRNDQNSLRDLGGKPPSQRKILSFFAGKVHGYLRPTLLQYWENKDPDMKIFSRMPRTKGSPNYITLMKTSKYCICAKGYEVNSPRVVEAIFYECVPVIISDDFVPPFFNVLNWESFAVFVPEKDIPRLKDILLSIPKKRYLEMYKRVKQVQKHFLWHDKPVKYDIFHMILHSIWFNRVFRMRPA